MECPSFSHGSLFGCRCRWSSWRPVDRGQPSTEVLSASSSTLRWEAVKWCKNLCDKSHGDSWACVQVDRPGNVEWKMYPAYYTYNPARLRRAENAFFGHLHQGRAHGVYFLGTDELDWRLTDMSGQLMNKNNSWVSPAQELGNARQFAATPLMSTKHGTGESRGLSALRSGAN